MATKKVKKFGRGGDIITGLGAILLGKHLYDKYNEPKSKDASTDSPSKTQTRTPEVKPSGPYKDPDPDVKVTKEVPAANKEEVKAANKRALDQSKGQPEVVPKDLTDKDRNTLYESDKALVRTDDGKAKPVGGANKPRPRIPSKAQGSNTNTGVDAGIAEGNKKSKSYPSVTRNFVPNEERAAIPYPAKAAADKKAADKAAADKRRTDSNPLAFGPRNTFITKERSDQANKAVGNAWRAQNPNLIKSQDEKFKDYQDRNAKYQKMLEGFKDKKSGGAVKKMASGGKISSASSRADGIAQRGKTRGRTL